MNRFLVVAALLSAGPVFAETRIVRGPHDLFAVDVVLDERPVATTGHVESRLIYLNRNGVTLTQGSTDSRKNRSSIVSGMVAIPAWNPSADVWSETVECMRDLFAPFDVRFTESDPGSASHVEAIFGGNGTMLGLPVRPAGVAPMSTSCRAIENSIVFAFTDDLPSIPRKICEVMAQEIAHSYGLDHELLAEDLMSYLSFSGERTFQDTVAECGELSARACGVPGYASCRQQQNSHALLLERLGPARDASDMTVDEQEQDSAADEVSCRAGRPSGSLALALVMWLVATSRRSRRTTISPWKWTS